MIRTEGEKKPGNSMLWKSLDDNDVQWEIIKSWYVWLGIELIFCWKIFRNVLTKPETVSHPKFWAEMSTV